MSETEVTIAPGHRSRIRWQGRSWRIVECADAGEYGSDGRVWGSYHRLAFERKQGHDAMGGPRWVLVAELDPFYGKLPRIPQDADTETDPELVSYGEWTDSDGNERHLTTIDELATCTLLRDLATLAGVMLDKEWAAKDRPRDES